MFILRICLSDEGDLDYLKIQKSHLKLNLDYEDLLEFLKLLKQSMEEVGIKKKLIKEIIKTKILPLKKLIVKPEPKPFRKRIGGKKALKKLIPILHSKALKDFVLG